MLFRSLLCGIAVLLLMGLEPGTSYASLWWKLGLIGIGYGLTLSPLTTAVFSATPPQRAGLGSSMYNASNRIGNTLGIAVLGAFVVQQFSGNIATQLIQRGVPASLSATIATKVAGAGAQASHVSLARHLPLSLTALHQAMNQAFVDALHGSFLLSGVALLVASVLVAVAFKQEQAAPRAEATQEEEMITAPVAVEEVYMA